LAYYVYILQSEATFWYCAGHTHNVDRNSFSECDTFFGSVEEKVKVSQALLSVFVGQSDACLFPDESYKTMVELNPQLKQKLRTIVTLDNLLIGIGFFRKTYKENLKKETFKRILTLQNSEKRSTGKNRYRKQLALSIIFETL
jgi:hypothetical protein